MRIFRFLSIVGFGKKPQLFTKLATKLQVLSSIIGVTFIQFAGIPVFLDGNIIDLGVYKLQVAEACSGLRYLFPLMSFGWLIAVLYNGPNWHRPIIFLSAVPITIFMNSFRIGMIGVLVNEYGTSQAEGFLHYFEGWIIFISCTLVLYLVAWFLMRFFSFSNSRVSDVLRIDFDGIHQPLVQFISARSNPALAGAATVLLLIGLVWHLKPTEVGHDIPRSPFAIFPLEVDNWHGSTSILDSDIERILAADDYLLANYQVSGEQVGLLMSFYKSQTDGSGIHSPEVCLPAGGWEVSSWQQVPVTIRKNAEAEPFHVNRAVIQKGIDRQLVYYWFEAQGRRATNDYEAKFLSIWNTIASGRSDGGLVRLTTPIYRTESVADAEGRLNSFLQNIMPFLPEYFPPLSQAYVRQDQ